MAHSISLLKSTKRSITLLLISIFTLNISAQSNNEPVPDFTLESVDGGSFTLSDHLGKVVLINFMGSTCPLCINAGPIIQQKLVDDFSDYDDLVVVGIDAWDGSKSQVQSFRVNAKIDFELLMKGSPIVSLLGTQYGHFVIVDREGNFAFVGGSHAESDIDIAVTALQSTLDIVMSVNDIFDDRETLYNFPNPVINQTNIHYKNNKAENVIISIHDITGKMIKEVYNGYLEPGNYDFPFNKGNNPSGIYFYKLTKNNIQIQVKRLIIR